MVHKSNILATSRLWEQVVQELAQRFPAVDYSSMLVDNAAFQLAVNPVQFNGVMLLDNMQEIFSATRRAESSAPSA